MSLINEFYFYIETALLLVSFVFMTSLAFWKGPKKKLHAILYILAFGTALATGFHFLEALESAAGVIASMTFFAAGAYLLFTGIRKGAERTRSQR